MANRAIVRGVSQTHLQFDWLPSARSYACEEPICRVQSQNSHDNAGLWSSSACPKRKQMYAFVYDHRMNITLNAEHPSLAVGAHPDDNDRFISLLLLFPLPLPLPVLLLLLSLYICCKYHAASKHAHKHPLNGPDNIPEADFWRPVHPAFVGSHLNPNPHLFLLALCPLHAISPSSLLCPLAPKSQKIAIFLLLDKPAFKIIS
ncbi:predicted protein [Uncinocarpus reesii 1704]|uniref:Uncharacterized protein n=1 Tax=Uncinocarpus reesii (strain UAMH 1704) TaxID=336963 RepID=C4JSS9_UNCRE|nr:uncharacterized protein UREG_05518 [Uncinocarpus reesii 1704]EEP80676.1 predicted protein [Uncinocarpus reesii 1704]